MRTTRLSAAWQPPTWPAELLAKVEELPAWVPETLPAGWWDMSLAELGRLPEPELVAVYRASRPAAGSRIARLAAMAMLERYRDGISWLVRRYSPRGPAQHGQTHSSDRPPPAARDFTEQVGASEQELRTHAWMAFFEAVEGFDPGRRVKLMTFAGYGIKEALIKQLVDSLPQEPHSDDTRKAWDRTLSAWADLAQKWGRPPRPDEVADHLAPQLVPALPTLERARRAVLDVFRVLVDNRVRLGEPEEESEEAGPVAQPADNTWNPELLVERTETSRGYRAELDRIFGEAATRLGDRRAAGKLLALRVLLNVKETDRGKKMDYGMYKIKEFINDPPDEISERWAGLWLDYGLGRYGLPRDWDTLRRWFDPPIEVAELRAFYRFTLSVVGWDRAAGTA